MATPFPLFEGKYEIITKLKEGGMGAVYKVRHRLLDEVRVIKLIRPQLESDEAIRARFLREARTAVRLRHPNIAQFYDFSMDDDGNAFIVMEFIEGITLEEMITRVGPPPLPLALVIAEQSLQPIGYLHRRNTIHRDISPDNLMLSRNDEGFPLVKLIDLGIAKVLEEEGHSQITRRGLTGTGMFLGKVRYASPEQFHAQEGVSMDARSDLYSFGLVLYELLTGLHPIRGSSVPSFIAGHLFHPPMPFGESDPEGRIPEELRAVVLRALAKSPDARFASAEAFIQALAPIKARHPLSPEDAVVTLDGVTAVFTQKTQVGGIGSTQARLDRQFGIAPTPPPLPVSTPGGGQSVAALRTSPPPPTTPVPPPAPPPVMAPEREDTSPLQFRPEAAEERAPTAPGEGAGSQETRVLAIPGAGAARAAKLVAAARELVDQGRWGEALERLTTAQSLDSENAEVQALRERAEQALAAEAERARRAAALAAHARRIEGLLDAGQLEQARQGLEEALSEVGRDEALDALLERLAAAEDALVAALGRQAEAAVEAGRPDDAVAAVQQAIALRPDDEPLRQLLQRAEAAAERRRRLAALLPEIEAALDDRELLTARVALDQAIGELGTDPALEAQVERLSTLVAAEVEALRGASCGRPRRRRRRRDAGGGAGGARPPAGGRRIAGARAPDRGGSRAPAGDRRGRGRDRGSSRGPGPADGPPPARRGRRPTGRGRRAR
ncbi:MAG: serine/threonine-protein kinase [Thermoanaerobaculaceae bacterium]